MLLQITAHAEAEQRSTYGATPLPVYLVGSYLKGMYGIEWSEINHFLSCAMNSTYDENKRNIRLCNCALECETIRKCHVIYPTHYFVSTIELVFPSVSL